mgnify:CR=1 FL=1
MKTKVVMIHGRRGAGKTTFAKLLSAALGMNLESVMKGLNYQG